MLTAAVVRELVAAGLTGETLVAACERIESSDIARHSRDIHPDIDKIERKRAADRARLQRKRESEDRAMSRDVAVKTPDKVSPLKNSPTPPIKITPLQTEIGLPNARETGLFEEPTPEPKPDDVRIAFEAFQEIARECGLSVPKKLSDRWRGPLKARIRDADGIQGFLRAICRIRDGPHLLGHNDKGWKADFEFVLQPKSFNRLMEGFYDDRSKPRTDPLMAALAEQREYLVGRNGSGSGGLPGEPWSDDEAGLGEAGGRGDRFP